MFMFDSALSHTNAVCFSLIQSVQPWLMRISEDAYEPSGKSSVVYDSIANEAQRLLFENFSLFIRHLLLPYARSACRLARTWIRTLSIAQHSG
jgi:hypothetical protein